MALLAPAAGGTAMAAIDVWHYQLLPWELDLSYYRQDGPIGRRERIHELVLRSVPARMVRRLRSYGMRAYRAGAEGTKSVVAPLLHGGAPRPTVATPADDGHAAWWEEPAMRPTTLDVPLLPGCTQTCTILPHAASGRDWESIRAAMERRSHYCTSGSLMEKSVSIFRMGYLLALELPEYARQRRAAHLAKIREEEAAELAAERAAAEADAKAHPNLMHPPTLAPAYRNDVITAQARAYVYERMPFRVAAGLVTGGAIAGMASMSFAGTKKLNSLGPLRFFGGFVGLGGVAAVLVDLTTRAGYEDAFLESGEAPPRATPWILKPNKTFIMLAGTFGGPSHSAFSRSWLPFDSFRCLLFVQDIRLLPLSSMHTSVGRLPPGRREVPLRSRPSRGCSCSLTKQSWNDGITNLSSRKHGRGTTTRQLLMKLRLRGSGGRKRRSRRTRQSGARKSWGSF